MLDEILPASVHYAAVNTDEDPDLATTCNFFRINPNILPA